MAGADETDPGQTAIGMDFRLSAVELDLRVNDIPVFDPARYFPVEAEVNSQINLNPAFQQGENVISVRVRPFQGEASAGFASSARLRFGYWPAGTFPQTFSERPFVADVVLSPSPEGGGFALQSLEAPGQEFMRVTSVDDLARPLQDGWVQFNITVDLQVRLPRFAWMTDAVQLDGSPEERSQVVAQLARARDALDAGIGPTTDVLRPYLDQKAGSVGMETGAFTEMSFGVLFDAGSGFGIDPFDAGDRPIALFGNGRVATLLPVPVTFSNAEQGRQGTLYLYYWKDATGQWRVVH